MIGLGLLELVSEWDIFALADRRDVDGDGVSGRPNLVWDETQQAMRLGRFGWKANQPNLTQQTAAALIGDLGITSSYFPAQNCTAAQTQCQAAVAGGEPEISDATLASLVLYTQTLAVPARRAWDNPEVLRGKALFAAANCTACHVETLSTRAGGEIPELSGQVIHPYTDLLLHDMGEDLADGRPDFLATGSEWRTPPLWGIGLVKTVNQHTRFLHDGRAHDLAEAVLWHGGEGSASREAFRDMSARDRQALIRFLESL
jgi:CxxC motif-containing protein (DUF1111 family)